MGTRFTPPQGPGNSGGSGAITPDVITNIAAGVNTDSIAPALAEVLTAISGISVGSGGGVNPLDGIYFDPVGGTAGIASTNGLPDNPSNNLPDVRTMMAARKNNKIYLVNGDTAGSHTLLFDVNMDVEIVGDVGYTISAAAGVVVNILGDLSCYEINNNGYSTSDITVYGDVTAFYGITNTYAGHIVIGGNYKGLGMAPDTGGVINISSGSITIRGNVDTRTVNNQGNGTISILGDCKVVYSNNYNNINNSSGGIIKLYGTTQALAIYNAPNSTITIGNVAELFGSIVISGYITGEIKLVGGQPHIIDFSGSGGTSQITKITSNDFLTLSNISAGDLISAIDLQEASQLTLDASCGAANVTLFGTGALVDNTGGVLVPTDNRHLSTGGGGSGGDTVIYPNGITVVDGATLVINSSALVIGDITLGVNSTLEVNGNLQVIGSVTLVTGSTLTISGDLFVSADLTINDDGTGFSPAVVSVYGSCFITNGITNTDGTISISGNCQVSGISQTGNSNISISGGCYNPSGDIIISATGPAQSSQINIYGDCVSSGINIDGGITGTINIMGNCVSGDDGISNLSTDSTIHIRGNCFVPSGCDNVGNLIVDGDFTGSISNGPSTTFIISGNLNANNCYNNGSLQVKGIAYIYNTLTNKGDISGDIRIVGGTSHLIDFTGSGGNGSITKITTNDPITLMNMSVGDVITAIDLQEASQLTLDVTCLAATITIYGTGALVDNTVGVFIPTDHRLSNHW